MAHHYLPDWQGAHLPVVGTHWSWALDSVNWVFQGEAADTVWHHDASTSPWKWGNFSVYEHYYLTHQLPIDLRGKAAGNYLVEVTQGERR